VRLLEVILFIFIHVRPRQIGYSLDYRARGHIKLGKSPVSPNDSIMRLVLIEYNLVDIPQMALLANLCLRLLLDRAFRHQDWLRNDLW